MGKREIERERERKEEEERKKENREREIWKNASDPYTRSLAQRFPA
jgi:hypothetical protein